MIVIIKFIPLIVFIRNKVKYFINLFFLLGRFKFDVLIIIVHFFEIFFVFWRNSINTLKQLLFLFNFWNILNLSSLYKLIMFRKLGLLQRLLLFFIKLVGQICNLLNVLLHILINQSKLFILISLLLYKQMLFVLLLFK
jgi:hypothetical protein